MFDDLRFWQRRDRRALAVAVVLIPIAVGLDTPLALMALRAPPQVERVAAFVTDFGLSGYMYLLSGLIALGALWRRRRTEDARRRIWLACVAERAIYFFTVIAVSGLLAQLIKHLVGRTRPVLLHEAGAFNFQPFSLQNTHASFPSGHTTTAFAAAVALSFIAPRVRPFWIAAACFIGISRVVVHAHFPSDVLGGAVLGSLTALAVSHWFAARMIAFEPEVTPLRMKPVAPRGRR